MAEKEIPKKNNLEESSTVGKVESIEVMKESTVKDQKTASIKEKSIDELKEEFMESLTPIERDVLSVANEILKKKKYPAEIITERVENLSPMVEKIYSKSIARFENQKGYERELILKAIQSLEEKKWIITGQRVTKEEILENPIKKSILNFIKKYPGIHARDPRISEELNITRNPFIKHMASLESFDLVRSQKLGSTLNYFPIDLPDIFDDLAVLFQNEIVIKIIKAFIEKKDVTLMDLAQSIGVYHRAIQYHIKFLVEHDVLIEIEEPSVELESVDKTDSRRKYYKVNLELLRRYNKLFKIPPFCEWI